MKDVRELSIAIANELAENLTRIDPESANALMDAILSAKRVYVAGCGRSLLMMRGFAMRLMHMGFTSYVVGETVTPAIQPGDLLIIGSGSGETGSLVSMAKKASSLGVKIAHLTIYPDSTIAKMADVVVRIPGMTSKSDKDGGAKSIQPGGSMFEQCLLLFGDAMILALSEHDDYHLDNEIMTMRHANLE